MAETNAERKTRIIITIEEFTTERLPDEMEEVFFELEELYLAKDNDSGFWVKVRVALKSNKYLYDKDVHFFITKKDLAAKGYWWYDCELW